MPECDSLLITGATIIDGISDSPISGKAILTSGKRIKAIGTLDEFGSDFRATRVDARGKWAIPGLMNANVHLFMPLTMEHLANNLDQCDLLIEEAAQVALRSGLTTVFDTWGPRRFLMQVRDRINAGHTLGSRIFCAGNIIGFDGPCSPDFMPHFQDVSSQRFVRRVEAIWVENVGRHLMWLTADQVAREVGTYIKKGIDFLKYACNEHGQHSSGAFIQFAPRVQKAIVEEAHREGLSAQAHCTSVEGLRIAIEAGCDLITHCNITGPTPIPPDVLRLFNERGTGAVVFALTQRRLNWLFDSERSDTPQIKRRRLMYMASDLNVRNLINSDAPLLLATDGGMWPPDLLADPKTSRTLAPDIDNSLDLAEGHFFWLKAMEEKGCPPIKVLQAATRNIAIAYGKGDDLGSLREGRFADIVLLDKSPLEGCCNYRAIHAIVKDGQLIDRSSLPLRRILTKPLGPPVEEETTYIPSAPANSALLCPCCALY